MGDKKEVAVNPTYEQLGKSVKADKQTLLCLWIMIIVILTMIVSVCLFGNISRVKNPSNNINESTKESANEFSQSTYKDVLGDMELAVGVLRDDLNEMLNYNPEIARYVEIRDDIRIILHGIKIKAVFAENNNITQEEKAKCMVVKGICQYLEAEYETTKFSEQNVIGLAAKVTDKFRRWLEIEEKNQKEEEENENVDSQRIGVDHETGRSGGNDWW